MQCSQCRQPLSQQPEYVVPRGGVGAPVGLVTTTQRPPQQALCARCNTRPLAGRGARIDVELRPDPRSPQEQGKKVQKALQNAELRQQGQQQGKRAMPDRSRMDN